MNTKRWRLIIALSIVVVLAAFSVLMHTRWNALPPSVRINWHWEIPGWLNEAPNLEKIQPGQSFVLNDKDKREIVVLTEAYFDKGGECTFDYVFIPIDWIESFKNHARCRFINLLTKTDKSRVGEVEILLLRFWLKRVPVEFFFLERRGSSVHETWLWFNSEGNFEWIEP